jgi:diadenosine tetraphosphate (Ap4A) HIT family hydrolase
MRRWRWVTLPPRTPLPGYVCLVAKRHVREPFELPDSERRAFWDAVDRVASALNATLRPEKLNYEIHGNTIPHLHLHLFPWGPSAEV